MSLHKFAQEVASKGRGDDSLLIHMTPDEVQRLQQFAQANGRSLTINPETGLPEAGMLSDLFKMVAPIALGAFLGPGAFGIAGMGLSAGTAGLVTGGLTTLATGSLSRGLMAGLGAYGGAGLAESFMNAGSTALGGAGAEAALQAPSIDSFVGNAEGMTSGDAFNNFLKSDANPAVMGKADVFGAGAKAAMSDPLGFAKNNLGNLAYAAAPIMAGAMVPTTTKAPTGSNENYIRQFDFNINPDTGKPDPLYGVRTMAPVKANEWKDKTFQGQRDLFRQQNPNPYELGVGSLNQPPQQLQPTPMATGGIVALANGGYAAGGVPDYFVANPDVAKAYTENTYGLNPEQFAYVHAEKYGNAETASGQRAPTSQSAGAAYAATHGIDLQKNINDWIVNNPFATAADVTNALAGSGLTQTDVNPYLTANTSISDAQRYALSHIDEIDGLSGLQKGVLTALGRNPNMTQSEIDAAQAQYGLSDYDIQSPLIHGYQVANDQTAAAQKYLQDNPDVARWISSDEGKAYIKANPQFDASDIAYTHFQRYGEGEGRKWGLPAVVSTCPAPDMRILLANGSLKAAGDLQVGDVIRTQHETTLAWGDHPVTHVSIVHDVPRLKIELGDVEFVCSLDHKFFKAAGEWVTAKDVVLGDMLSGHTVRSLTQANVGDVVRITVNEAHTYICEGLLSHNKSPQAPVVNPPTSVVPGGTQLPGATVYDNGAYGNYGSGPATGVDYRGNTVSIATPGDIITNTDGTRTVVPNIPGRPYGGFTGIEQLKSRYTAGGGSLGYTSKAPKTIEEFNRLYNKQTGDSLAAYNYLMGKGGGKYPVKSGVPRIAENYNEFVLGKKTAGLKPAVISGDTLTIGGVTYDLKDPTKQPPADSKGSWQWDVSGKRWAQIAADGTVISGGDGNTSGNTAGTTGIGNNSANSISGLAQDANPNISVVSMDTMSPDAAAAAAATAADSAAASAASATGDAPGSDGSPGSGAKRGGLMPRGYAIGGGLGSLGSYSDGGRLLKGPGDGVSDSIPATIGRKQQPARLADGEFVIPARIVSELGNGSTDAGAKKLYAMMDRVQRARGKTTGKNKVAANSRADKHLPA